MDESAVSVLPLFPTSVLRFEVSRHAQLQQALVTTILALQQQHRGVQKTNIGGWHSALDLQHSSEPAMLELIQEIRMAMNRWAESFFELADAIDLQAWQIEMWANVNQRGHSNRAHDHFRSGIVASGFYYLRCGGEHVGGETVFINQQSQPVFVESDVPLKTARLAITPVDGQGYVFPSWQGHEVMPYTGNIPRITLAFNAGHPELPVKRSGDTMLRSRWRKFLGMR